MSVIPLLLIGIAAGFLATRIMRVETDIPTTIAIGTLGAIIGGLTLRALITVTGWLAGLVGAVLGAMLLIWLWRQYGPKR
ncbi:GlsB/YeaQ/YmgE family stress response membrane protein [Pseudothioclava nitratireducens]|uniref:GlsB/YeaQ/YmgE family stress response membrane protein n=1 Tax=Pseudothioclava nitratireducens TaxID=1928646 RepID=UPI0023DC30DB|nr:GlsB/YeaQ/YmgE family stress response membrane protein [Defluviimonas nitratireducens]MDF1620294.1 GlsB/YeaQ/YmgE family stress response membrane protein [Defluviimonas nitratireducens]